jgi:hypothetical protein
MAKIKQSMNIAQSIWRDNFWFIVAAILIVLFITTGIKSILNVRTMETQQSFTQRAPGTGLELHVEYPRRVSYNTGQTPIVQIWAVCVSPAQPCPSTLRLSSVGQKLQFAVDGHNLRWKPILKISLPSDGKAVSVQVASLNNQDTLKAKIRILVPGAATVRPPNATQFEGARDAKIRLWGAEFLNQLGIIISVFIVAIGWLQQRQKEEKQRLEEKFREEKQRRNEKKHEKRLRIEQILEHFEDDSINIPLSEFLKKYSELQSNWSEWAIDLKGRVKLLFESFLNNTFLMRLEDDLDHIERNYDQTERLFQKIAPKARNEILDNLERAIKEKDAVSVVALLEKYPERVDLLSTILDWIPKERQNAALEEVMKKNPEFPLSLRRLKFKFDFPGGVAYSLEDYPLASKFGRLSQDISEIQQDSSYQEWLSKHNLDISPFSDMHNPYKHSFDPKFGLRIKKFAPEGYLQEHNKFIFQNGWDCRAIFHDYCQDIPGEVREKSFFVLLPASLWHNYGTNNPKEIILHALAKEWLDTLALNYYTFFELKPVFRESLCHLLIWHCGSKTSAKANLFENIQSHSIKEEVNATFFKKIGQLVDTVETVDLNSSEMNALVSLRPTGTTNTRILCPSVDLDPQSRFFIPTENMKLLNTMADWLNSLHIYITYFVSAAQVPDPSSLSEPTTQIIFSESDLLQMCNTRLRDCSKDKVEARGLNELLIPGKYTEVLLANQAHGSPGEMIRLGQTLLLNHCRNHPNEEFLDIQELLDLKV